jgi:proteic killer suppression protein
LRVIVDFRCKETRELWMTGRNRRLSSIAKQALAKLQMMNQAANLEDLRVPPGNRLEALRGNRAGQYSIRINQQWRVCFRWTPEGPAAVEIADYH